MIQHKIDKAQNTMYVEVRQKPTADELVGAARLVASDPAYNKDLNAIVDLSQARLMNIEYEELMDFVHMMQNEFRLGRYARCAIVAPEGDQGGIFEDFSYMLFSPRIAIFQDPDQAGSWANDPPPPGLFEDPDLSDQNEIAAPELKEQNAAGLQIPQADANGERPEYDRILWGVA